MLMGAAWKCAHMIVEATTQGCFPTSTTQFCRKATHFKILVHTHTSCLLFIIHSLALTDSDCPRLIQLLYLLLNNLNDSQNQIKYHEQKKTNDTRSSVTERISMSYRKEINITPIYPIYTFFKKIFFHKYSGTLPYAV